MLLTGSMLLAVSVCFWQGLFAFGMVYVFIRVYAFDRFCVLLTGSACFREDLFASDRVYAFDRICVHLAGYACFWHGLYASSARLARSYRTVPTK